MKVGIFLPQVGEHATRENIIYIAKEAEKEGINSVWVLDRLLWPLNHRRRMWLLLMVHFLSSITCDPLTTLTYVGRYRTNSLGTSVIDMFFQNPVVLAKRFTTLDVLSDGRAIAGLGIGWSKDEYEVSGIPYKERGTRADEYIQSLKKYGQMIL